jgi:hypothetical protein
LGKVRRGKQRHREGVGGKEQNEYLVGRTMDCSTGKGDKVKGVRIAIRK